MKTQSELLSLVGQVVEPPVEGVQVISRPMDRAPDTGFVLVYVPRSDSFLHRSRTDREWYRRHGHGFFRLEHYEIAEFYGRRRNPALSFWWDVKVTGWSGKEPNRIFNVEIIVGLHNVGRAIAKYPALLLRDVRTGQYGVDGSGRTGLPNIPTSESNKTLFASGTTVVHPTTTLEVTALQNKLEISEQNPNCLDIFGGYELYAEDMAPVKGDFQITSQQLFEKLHEKGLPFK